MNSVTTPIVLDDSARPNSGFGRLFSRQNRLWYGRLRWWITALVLAFVLAFIASQIYTILYPAADTLDDIYVAINSITTVGQATVSELVGIIQNGLPEATFSTSRIVLPIILSIAGFLVPLGLICLANGQARRDFQGGTWGWLLSRPVDRGTLLRAVLLGDWLGMALLFTVLPFLAIGLVSLNEASGYQLDFPGYLYAAVLFFVVLIWWHALSVWSAVTFRSRALALWIPLLVLFFGNLLIQIIIIIAPQIGHLLWSIAPWSTAAFYGPTSIQGTLLSSASVVPVIATISWSILLYALVWWRLRRHAR